MSREVDSNSHDIPVLNRFITAKIKEQELQNKTRTEIAREIGFDRPQYLSMLSAGSSRVPIKRLPGFARALGVDLWHLFRLKMQEEWGEDSEIYQALEKNKVTKNEMEILEFIRETSNQADPPLNDRMRNALRPVLEDYKNWDSNNAPIES